MSNYNILLHAILYVYGFAIITIFVTKVVKPLNGLLLYGKNTSNKLEESPNSSKSLIQKNIDFLTTITVPKSWFAHYYVAFFINCSVIEALTNGTQLPSYVADLIPQPSQVTVDPVIYKDYKLIHIMLFIQAARRSFESYTITKFAKTSKMNFSHYLVGHMYYTLISLNCYLSLLKIVPVPYSKLFQEFTTIDYALLGIFGLASVDQFSNHYHLSTLVKYTVPNFKYVASPHYLDEIIIYLVVLVVSAKDGSFDFIALNYLVGWIFVVENLSVSSIETYKFYQTKFKDDFKLKWSIIPGIL
ncbi:roles in filamentous growth, cell polarity, and cellular elongation [Scheffersomyces xylosifermentans]|uniref:roles in filamentous growth, cell polarity, and cellular elongation n=1 Tax=Scheffersomyces xylosifermentans TaxID=1304137 RepID=UPI00315D7E96